MVTVTQDGPSVSFFVKCKQKWLTCHVKLLAWPLIAKLEWTGTILRTQKKCTVYTARKRRNTAARQNDLRLLRIGVAVLSVIFAVSGSHLSLLIPVSASSATTGAAACHPAAAIVSAPATATIPCSPAPEVVDLREQVQNLTQSLQSQGDLLQQQIDEVKSLKSTLAEKDARAEEHLRRMEEMSCMMAAYYGPYALGLAAVRQLV
ncbi:hypothetical protein PIB30_043152 [Stylosanthes scabra]|uniref:Uncharacterized protein n=1 Tax=Stylosanthes scabra TaxID=79078 RepID=A0ABU6ZE71_9FABA|nr:hypothetical protein [Stylosanthes scabra]